MAALLALLAAASWGSSDFLAGNASRKSSAVSVVILTHFASVIALLFVAVDFGPLWTSLSGLASGDDGAGWAAPRMVGTPSTVDLAWGFAAGLGGGFGAMLLFRGLGRGSMAVVAPVTAAGAAIIPVIAGLATGDPLSALSITGIALALVAIVLVSLVAGDDQDVAARAEIQPETHADDAVAPPQPGNDIDDVDESLTIPPGWVEEFRRNHDVRPFPGGSSGPIRFPAPIAGSAVATMPPPTLRSVDAPIAPAVSAVPAPVSATTTAPVPTAQPAATMAATTHRHLRGLLRVIAALLLTLVAAAVWLTVGTLAEIDGRIEPAQVGVLALCALMAATSLISIWATVPLFRTSVDAAPSPTDRAADGAIASTPSRRRARRLLSQPGLPEALLSGVGFGLFFVFIYRASESAGQWPLIGARGISVVMFAVAAVVSSTSVLPAAGSRLAVVGAGLFDAIAAVLFVVATRAGLLSVAAVLASLYPAVTVLLARVVTKESIRPIQVAGLALALGAVGLLAL